jgi:hypothetical protein
MSKLEKTIAQTFLEMAQGLESGSYGVRPKIALTGMGSEHGEENAMAAAKMAAARGVDVYYIGTLEAEGITTVHVANDEEGHKKMEELVENGEVDGAVTMHFPFPIGVSTVGRVGDAGQGPPDVHGQHHRHLQRRPHRGHDQERRLRHHHRQGLRQRPPDRGHPERGRRPADRDGAQPAPAGGYDFDWATSARADGGAVMRGNDVLEGTPDVMVTDSLTGNVLIKMLSAYTTGGSFEATGYGYGPGIGKGYTTS